MVEGLFLLGVVGNILGVAPDHDEHHGHLVEDTYKYGAKDKGEEEQENACAASYQICEREENDKDGSNVVNNLQDWLNPHDFEG